MNLIEEIFKDEPSQWGLRGDPYMWRELKNAFSDLTENLSQSGFEKELEKRFKSIMQQEGKQTSNKTVWFKKFPQLGMSGGTISLEWWKEMGLPLIKRRYKDLNLYNQ